MILRGDQLDRFLRQSAMEASGVQSAIMRVNGIFGDIFQPQHLSLFDFKRTKPQKSPFDDSTHFTRVKGPAGTPSSTVFGKTPEKAIFPKSKIESRF